MPALDPLTVILIIAIGFLLAGALAPLEALGWWAGWYGQSLEPSDDAPPDTSRATARRSDPVSFVVFLTGIHSVSHATFARREQALLTALERRLENATIIEVFPYSVTNRALTGQRTFARFWRWALKRKLSGRTLAGFLINLRNLWQVAVSADRRYGPIYNQGSAEMILRALAHHGYQPGSGTAVTLIGYSGGGQIAMGAAPHLKAALGAPIQVVSLGGVLAADPGLTEIDRLYHLYGDRDLVQRLANVFFPGRWRVLRYSPWNRALEQGIVALKRIGPMDHTGKGGYLDGKMKTADGRTYFEVTVDALTTLIQAPATTPAPTRLPD